MARKLRDVVPRQQFEVAIQAVIGNKCVHRAVLSLLLTLRPGSLQESRSRRSERTSPLAFTAATTHARPRYVLHFQEPPTRLTLCAFPATRQAEVSRVPCPDKPY
jgi:hypothetical protein